MSNKKNKYIKNALTFIYLYLSVKLLFFTEELSKPFIIGLGVCFAVESLLTYLKE